MAWTARSVAAKTLVGRIRAGYDAMDPAGLNQVVVDPAPLDRAAIDLAPLDRAHLGNMNGGAHTGIQKQPPLGSHRHHWDLPATTVVTHAGILPPYALCRRLWLWI